MDPNSYKDLKTTRGYNYHYFVSKPQESVSGRPTVIFLHGFPSTSLDWSRQVPFFVQNGFPVIVPDLLGYGGTDKPTTPESYRMGLMAKDVVEILDIEGVEKAAVVGHDWGSTLTSKFVQYFPERTIAIATFAVGYTPPRPTFDVYQIMEMGQKTLGSDVLGYFLFFNEDNADKMIAEHLTSFCSLIYPDDPTLWAKHLAPRGALKEWLLKDTQSPHASYLSDEEWNTRLQEFVKHGITGGLCYYKAFVRGLTPKEDTAIPQERYKVDVPVFFGAALRDVVCFPSINKQSVVEFCPNHTIVDFDTDHWVPLAAPDKVNAELLKWIEGFAA